MKKRPQAEGQLGLFEPPEGSESATIPPSPSLGTPERDEWYVAGLLEQIKRDWDYLIDPEGLVEEDPAGVEFYEQRIRDYRDEIKKVRSQ